jgi:hypothetical protein
MHALKYQDTEKKVKEFIGLLEIAFKIIGRCDVFNKFFLWNTKIE